MGNFIDPKEIGLHPKTVIEKLRNKSFAIVIDRKSRIIMSDGRKILDKAERIIDAFPGAKVSLKTTAPVCSKTTAFLKEHGIKIM